MRERNARAAALADTPTQAGRLSPREERRLIRQVRRGRRAQAVLDRRGPMVRERRKRLARLVAAGRAATERMALANRGLVYMVANRYHSSPLPVDDLVQEGFIGLLEAMYRFEPFRSTRFSTYATWWIRQTVGRAIDQKARLIRLPVGQEERRRRMLRVIQALEQRLNRPPTSHELAEELDLPAAEVEVLLRASQQPLSLDQPLGDSIEDRGVTLGETLVDADADSFVSVAESERRALLQAALEALPAREARILEMRFGLQSGEDLTFEEIGRRIGLTRERVRQLQNKGLERLRDSPGRERLEAS